MSWEMYILNFANSVVSLSLSPYAIYSNKYIITQGNKVPILTSKNFKNWKNDVMVALAYANADSAVSDPKPPDKDTKQFQEWNTSNRVCLMTLKRVIPEVYQCKLESISTR